MTPGGVAGSAALDPGAVRVLTELVGGDSEALVEIVDAFLEEAPQRIAELRRGADGDDSVLAGRAAHTLKANALTFGAGRLASLCQEIEVSARAADLGPARDRIGEVEEAWAQVCAELSSLRERTAG